MSRDRLERIWRKNWERGALSARAQIRATFGPPLAPESIEFLDKEESEKFGALFSNRLALVDTEFDVDLEGVFGLITQSLPYSQPTVWFHGRTHEAGAILIPSREMWRAGPANWTRLGPDLIFAARDLSSGLCFEVQENENALRFWGPTWVRATQDLVGRLSIPRK